TRSYNILTTTQRPIVRPSMAKQTWRNPYFRPDAMAEIAPGPGENEIAHEAAKKASQVERAMGRQRRCSGCPVGLLQEGPGGRRAAAAVITRVLDGARAVAR